MPKPEALIFDLDGTLWDAIDSCVAAWNRVLTNNDHNLQVSRADFLASMGKNHQEICELYFTDLPFPKREALILSCYAQEIAEFSTTPPRLYPNVGSGVLKLAEQYRLAIVSNCQRPYLEAFLGRSGLRDCFESTLCYQDSGQPKAHNILQTLEKLKVKSLNAFYTGDTIGDQVAAHTANVPFGFAAYGFGKATEWRVSFECFDSIVRYFRD